MSWNQHKQEGQRSFHVTAAHAGHSDGWMASGSAQLTFNGNRYLPQPRRMQNLDYQHKYTARTQNNSSPRSAVQLDRSAGKRGLQVPPSRAGRTALPFSHSPAPSGEQHTATAGTRAPGHCCKCLQPRWGLCEGFVHRTRITVFQGWGMER